MHTVELLDQALVAAEQLGYRIRPEWLDGGGGGPCLVKGKKLLFLDLALGPLEQFHQVIEAIRSEPTAEQLTLSPELGRALRLRKTA